METPAVQMVLPLAEMLGWLRKGVGELIRQAGLQLTELLMEEEVRENTTSITKGQDGPRGGVRKTEAIRTSSLPNNRVSVY
jgi:hypothetical protein